MQKEQAVCDVRNMEVAVDKVLRRERAKKGVIIRNALYGDLRLRDDCEDGFARRRTIQADDLVGPVVTVTTPVQCLVESHMIFLPGGAAASKADLPGFYNPLPLETDMELSLYVLYEFKGRLHEVIVGDRETLSLPLKKHAVPEGSDPQGPFSPANLTLYHSKICVDDQCEGKARIMKQGENTLLPRRCSLALIRASSAYCIEQLKAHDPGAPTPREFVAVMLTAALALLWVWPRTDKKLLT